MSPQESKTVHLKATYTSPTHPQSHTISSAPLSLPTSQSPISVASKTSYLSALRAATIALQGTINTTLTARMEEDIARAQGTSTDKDDKGGVGVAGNKKGEVADEVAEEENYGEEVPGDDDD